MRFLIKDSENQMELTFPITPSSFKVGRGTEMELIHIHSLGDVALAGNPSLETIKIDCLFPAHNYIFCVTTPLDPYEYVGYFRNWCLEKTVVRLIISDTPVNVGVRVERIDYGEEDGSGDVKASLTFREYRPLAVVNVERPAETPIREPENIAVIEQVHEIVYGDTLWSICRKYYGDPLIYPKVAAYNNIPNPNLIYAGNVLKIPPANLL